MAKKSDIVRLPVPQLGKPTTPPPPALELVAHDASVSMGEIGPTLALVFDLMAPGLGSPMLIRITIPLSDLAAAKDIGEGLLRKVAEHGSANNHDA